MSAGRNLMLSLYYHGTHPYRWWRARQLSAAGRMPVAVLFYHRVADDDATPWTCSSENFRRQIRWLKRHYDLVTLEEARQRVRSGRNHRPTVSITFDDGYQENCQVALPLLIREGIPFTYFVCSQFVVDGAPFPHDQALGLRFKPNTLAELRDLVSAGVEIGSHTRTHADLGQLVDPSELYDELVMSRQELSSALGCAIRYFAFPYGLQRNLNPLAFDMAREAGYEAMCSAFGGFNYPGDDAFHLHRIHGEVSLLRLKNWLLPDPRKERRARAGGGNSTAMIEAAGVCTT